MTKPPTNGEAPARDAPAKRTATTASQGGSPSRQRDPKPPRKAEAKVARNQPAMEAKSEWSEADELFGSSDSSSDDDWLRPPARDDAAEQAMQRARGDREV